VDQSEDNGTPPASRVPGAYCESAGAATAGRGRLGRRNFKEYNDFGHRLNSG